MKKSMAFVLLTLFIFTGCNSSGFQQRAENYSRVQLIPTVDMGKNQDAEEVAEAAKAVAFYEELSASQPVFICDTWNYGLVDGKPRYELNSYPDAPMEIDSYGYCIQVDENYFLYNPIKTTDGNSISESMVYGEDTLNILVPEKHRVWESQIIPAYLERFWFDTVEVDNIYRERLGEELNTTAMDDLNINVIYVEDDQTYFTFNKDIAAKTNNEITDPIVMVYTGNIHPVQAFGMMSRGLLMQRNSDNVDEMTGIIKAIAARHGVEDIVRSIQQVAG